MGMCTCYTREAALTQTEHEHAEEHRNDLTRESTRLILDKKIKWEKGFPFQ